MIKPQLFQLGMQAFINASETKMQFIHKSFRGSYKHIVKRFEKNVLTALKIEDSLIEESFEIEKM